MASSQLIARHARETSGRLAPAAHFAKFESRCIDRLARSIGDLQDFVRTVQARAASACIEPSWLYDRSVTPSHAAAESLVGLVLAKTSERITSWREHWYRLHASLRSFCWEGLS
jgi:hypothetical protein